MPPIPTKQSSNDSNEIEMEIEESMIDGNQPEYLRAYYQFLFPHTLFFQWLSYANVKPDYFNHREFSFTLSGDIYLRFNSFDTLAEMRRSIMERLPTKIDIGAVYNLKPKECRKVKLLSFQPMEHELVFDIDMTDYDDVRTCCKGTSICNRCWMFMIIAARILESFLRKDFGFKDILWVYSGRRGIHCWVADRRARLLKPDARDAIVNFINIFDGGQFKAKKVEIDGLKGVHPSIGRAVKIIDEYFEELMIVKQNFLQTKSQIETIANLCLDQQLRDQIKRSLLEDSSLKTSDRWRKLVELSQLFYGSKNSNPSLNRSIYKHRFFLEELKLQLCYPRLDTNVTRGLNHLLKMPFSVHPKTGKICVPIDFKQIDKFDPFKVPTLKILCEELDRLSPTSNTTEESMPSSSIAYKTSLSSSLNLFREFIIDIEQNLRAEKEKTSTNKLTF
ncbi:DNA primase small subunit-like protein [Sarcoptes scabiei]|uniref:DNA primase n=1 Tax=Sarcoptes scabiei TaxID=52283 RepID=A0A132A6U9_SARSC|nr:DNA primase small subunit-like protein [Sarcoptes scabiei]